MVLSVGYRVRVRVQGELDPAWWSDRFAGLTVAPERDGTTLLSGELADQAAVHGLLGAVRDLGLSLVTVETSAVPADDARSER